MLKRLQLWILDLPFVIKHIHGEVEFAVNLARHNAIEEFADKSLARDILKVKDFSQVKRALSADERKAYCADAAVILNTQVFKDIINEIQYDQLVFMGLQSDNDRQLMIGRGTINGADLVEERITTLAAEHEQNVRDAQPIPGGQQFEPITPLETN